MSVLSAQELHRRGVIAMNAGRLPLATRLLQQALTRATDEGLRALIEASLAYAQMDTSDFRSALAALERALEFPDLSADVFGVLTAQRAVILHRAGRTPESLLEFARAIEALRDRPLDLARAFMNRGNAHLQRDHQAAVSDFASAAEAATSVGETGLAAQAGHNEGYALYLQGDLVGALARMESSARELAGHGPLTAAILAEDRAEVLMVAGLRQEGVALLRQAGTGYGRLRMRQRQGESEVTLATHLRAHDPREARRAAARARRRFALLGSEQWRVRADAVILAAEVDLGGRSQSLLVLADKLVQELEDQGLAWGAASIRLHAARVHVRRAEFDEARRRLAQVRLNDAAPLTIKLLARDARSELAAAQGRRVAALSQIRQGLAELHAWQSSFGSLDLQTMVVGHGVRLAARALELAVESGDPVVVTEWSERARMLASRIQPVRPPADDQMAADLAELRSLQASADGPRVPEQRAHRDLELRRRVRERAWQLRGSGAVTEPAPVDKIRHALGTDTALVAWVISRGRLDALVVTDEGETVHHLGAYAKVREELAGLLPDLDMAASDLPKSLERVVREGLAERLEQLADALVTPLLERIGDRRVVATPSGGLAGTPWSLLPGLVGRPVTVAPSATSWLLHRSQPLHAVTAGFVAGPRVERAVDEVTAASRAWPGAEILVDEKATADGVTALAGQVDVLHVAAHGRHSADNPLFSGLELAGGPWFGYDIDRLTHVPPVVILSACEVGRSSVRFGEELIGMTAAWLHAGARCVIASPSAVADTAAHDVLTAMHEHLARGLDPAAALAASVPAVTGDAAPAPFVCFGSGW